MSFRGRSRMHRVAVVATLTSLGALFSEHSWAAPPISLEFPLSGFNPYTANMTAVLDHERAENATGFYCNQDSDGSTIEYTGVFPVS